MLNRVKTAILAGVALVAGSVALPAMADGATDYTTQAVSKINSLQGAFDTIYGAAFGVMITIVVALVVWKYSRKLGSKV